MCVGVNIHRPNDKNSAHARNASAARSAGDVARQPSNKSRWSGTSGMVMGSIHEKARR
jgi:hypothetical protein